MKYENAGDILPKELLDQIKKYAAGKLLYIPTTEEKRSWGESSGSKEKYVRRNVMIRNKYAHGVTVSELADEYFLSLDSIKKIIYNKKCTEHMLYEPSIESAIKFANVGMMEEWVHSFLLFTKNDNQMLKDWLKEEAFCYGVVKFPLRLIQIEDITMKDTVVMEGMDLVEEKLPLIIGYKEGSFAVLVQHDLFLAMKRQRMNVYPCIIVIRDKENYKRFLKYFNNILFFCDGS